MDVNKYKGRENFRHPDMLLSHDSVRWLALYMSMNFRKTILTSISVEKLQAPQGVFQAMQYSLAS